MVSWRDDLAPLLTVSTPVRDEKGKSKWCSSKSTMGYFRWSEAMWDTEWWLGLEKVTNEKRAGILTPRKSCLYLQELNMTREI
jgi:hypothetical protein